MPAGAVIHAKSAKATKWKFKFLIKCPVQYHLNVKLYYDRLTFQNLSSTLENNG